MGMMSETEHASGTDNTDNTDNIDAMDTDTGTTPVVLAHKLPDLATEAILLNSDAYGPLALDAHYVNQELNCIVTDLKAIQEAAARLHDQVRSMVFIVRHTQRWHRQLALSGEALSA